jgi:hypothetical protein
MSVKNHKPGCICFHCHTAESVVRDFAPATPTFTTPRMSEEKKLYGCGDCDPCIGGRPDQCAVGPCEIASNPEGEEEKSETECAKCHEEYALRDGQEPTEFCDECAHKVIDELRAQLRAAQTEAEGAKKKAEALGEELKPLRLMTEGLLAAQKKIS